MAHQTDTAETPAPQIGDATRQRYLPVLDGIRGLAAVMVVLLHMQGLFGGASFPRSYLAVDLFFVMSALVLWSSYGERLHAGMTTLDFTRLRLLRLYPLYLLGTVLGIAVACLSHRPASGDVALALLMLPKLQNLANNALFPFDRPAWSLFFEVLGSIGLAVLALRITTTRLLVVAGLSLAAVAVLAMLRPEHDLDMGFTSRNMIGGFARALADFSLGLLLARVLLPRLDASAPTLPDRVRRSALWCWLPILAAFAILAAPVPQAFSLAYDMAAVVLACPVILAIAALARPGPRLTAAFKLAGIVSFPLYAIHEPIKFGVALILRHHPDALGAPVALAATVAFTVIAAMMADRCFDRPIRSFLLKKRTRVGTKGMATAAG